MNSPVLSIYITNHNYGKYIEKAIQSVLNQTFKDFELIIIDDGSTDNSMETIRKFSNISRIKIIEQENQGLTVSNNIAIKVAAGKYIMRLDADDYLAPEAAELMVEVLDSKPKVALVFPDYFEVDEDGEILSEIRRHDFENDVSLHDQPAHGACTMIRLDVLKSIGGYDENFSRQDGYDLWLKIIHNYPVININKPLFYYRKHGHNLTSNEELLLETRSRIFSKHVHEKNVKPIDVLAIIPIRGNYIDKRSFALEKLGDKTLVDWTISETLKSKMINHIIASTPDDDVIHHLSANYENDVIIHKRDKALAQLNSRICTTIEEIISMYSKDHTEPDALLILNTESPFRNQMYINQAIDVMQFYEVDSVCGVRLEDDIFYIHDGAGLKIRSPENGLRLERDDLYRKVGGLSLVTTQYFKATKEIVGGKTGHVVVDQKSATSIRSKLDWKIAQMIAQNL